MLKVEPRERATLTEVMNHPWMIKSFNGPLENYLPHREPLQMPLDESVIEKMHGFDFGSSEYIKRQLTNVLNSAEYLSSVKAAARRPHPSDAGSKKGSVFDFYQRRKSNTSKDTLTPPSMEAVHLGDDPVNAYNPLISIYYLVREKQEREKVESNPGAFFIPQSPGQKPLQVADLPPPEPAVLNTGTYESPGEPATGGRTRPRARTQGEDEGRTSYQPSATQLAQTPVIKAPPGDATPKKESTAAGLLRRFSTRRGRDSTRQVDKDKEAAAKLPPPATPTVAVQEPSLPPPRQSLNIRKPRETPPSAYREVVAKHPDLLAPPADSPTASPNLGAAGRLRKGLGRSTSVNSGEIRRRWSTKRGASESIGSKQSALSDSEKASLSDAGKQTTDASSDDSRQQPARLSSRARSTGHSRRESTNQRAVIMANGIDSEVPEETDAELAEAEDREGGQPFTKSNPSQDTIKPVYLKGLFSVSTTSNKPLTFIRSDIIRVLKQLGVEYREQKGGFNCRHMPSIDLNKVVDDPEEAERTRDRARGMRQSFQHRRKISFAGIRDKSDRDRDDADLAATSSRPPLTPRTPSKRLRPADASAYTTDEDNASDSDRDRMINYNATRRRSTQTPRGNGTAPTSDPAPLSPRPLANEPLPSPAPRPTDGPSYSARPAGETTTHVQSDLGNSMILRFEILVVKVPFIGLHGLQFKKVDGGTWQYKKMAEEILGLLKL